MFRVAEEMDQDMGGEAGANEMLSHGWVSVSNYRELSSHNMVQAVHEIEVHEPNREEQLDLDMEICMD